MNEKKKMYSPPTITNFGDVITKTQGLGGDVWECLMPKPYVAPIKGTTTSSSTTGTCSL
jgi:hypothetical protein